MTLSAEEGVVRTVTLILSISSTVAVATAWLTGKFHKRDVDNSAMEQRIKALEEQIVKLEDMNKRLENTCNQLHENTLKVGIWWKYVERAVPQTLFPRLSEEVKEGQ